MHAQKQLHHHQHWHIYIDLEMTVLPIPQRSKHPNYRWKKIQWSKLHTLANTLKGINALNQLFRLGGAGLAVVCGRPSENLFVIDCDSPQSLAHVQSELHQREIHAPTVRSSRGGHIYLRAREGAVKGIAAGTLNQPIEIKGDGQLAVLPPTIHESGWHYHWQDGIPTHIPTISIDAIDFLRDEADNPVYLTTTGNSNRRLHDTTRHYLKHGFTLPEGSRNQSLFDAARDYAYIGKTKTDAHYDLLPIARASGLSESEATDTITSAFANKRPPAPADDSITAKLSSFLAGATWHSDTDRRVFAALIKRRAQDAYNRTKGIFRASFRELMQLTGFRSWQTIKRSLQRLTDLNYLQSTGRDKASRANCYRFTDMVIQVGTFFDVQNLHTNTAVSLRSNYCVLLHTPLTQALGKSADIILKFLRENPICHTISEIATAVDRHRTTVSRHLKTLLEYDLIFHHEDGYTSVATTVSHEQAILRDTGAYHKQSQLQQRIDQDRAIFALNPILDYLYKQTVGA